MISLSGDFSSPSLLYEKVFNYTFYFETRMSLTIAVGSTNPTKVQAVKDIFSNVFEKKIVVISRDVATGIEAQPMDEETTIQGGINRAKHSFDEEVDFAVGIEGGIHHNEYGYFLRAWIAIWDGDTLGLGGCASLQLPSVVIQQLKEKKKELGEVMDILTKKKNVGKKEGAFGVFTKKFLSRKESFYDGIYVALAPFLQKDLYKQRHLQDRLSDPS